MYFTLEGRTSVTGIRNVVRDGLPEGPCQESNWWKRLQKNSPQRISPTVNSLLTPWCAVRLSPKGNTGSRLFTEVKPCWTGLISGWVTIGIKYPVLYCLGSQAGIVDINHAFHLYYKSCMWTEFQSISTWFRGFSPGTPVSSLLKIDSQSNPSGCGAVLRSHIWIVFRGRVPSRLHNFFGPTSLSCALGNSVYGLR